MLILREANIEQLTALLDRSKHPKINEFFTPKDEDVAPPFLLEFAINKLHQDYDNAFWWSPRLIVVDALIVGMGGFKSVPDSNGSVEIGYGIVPSQQRNGFATQAVALILEESFSCSQIQTVVALTSPSNRASWRVLEKNSFVREGSKDDPDDGELWIWRKSR